MNKRTPYGILFSGGLDSLCAAILQPSARLIRVATGSRYDAHERGCAEQLANSLRRPLVHVDDVLDLGKLEQLDGLIPGRNALIVLAAAPHAVGLSLTSVAGDGTHATDKDDEFADIMTALLRKLYGSGSLYLPHRDVSKHQLAMNARVYDPQALKHALPHVWSCYGAGGLHCGHCKACVRLWAALVQVDLEDYGPQFLTRPWKLPANEYRAVFEGRGEEADNALARYNEIALAEGRMLA